MSDSFPIGRIRGIELSANWTWLIILALVVWSLAGGVFPQASTGLSSVAYVAMGVVAALLCFGSIVMHELGHAWQARREGMEVDGVTLWALGGVARFAGTFPSAGAEFRVAVAGPLVSLLLGLVFLALAAVFRSGCAVDGVVTWLGYINLLLVAFNLVPALPMDGGRFLRAAFWRARRNLAWVTSVAAGLGFVLGAAMLAIGLASCLSGTTPGGLWLAFIGVFVMIAGRAEAQTAALRTALAGLRVRDMMASIDSGAPPPPDVPHVDPDADLARSIAAILQVGGTLAVVVREGRTIGFLDVLRITHEARPGRLHLGAASSLSAPSRP